MQQVILDLLDLLPCPDQGPRVRSHRCKPGRSSRPCATCRSPFGERCDHYSRRPAPRDLRRRHPDHAGLPEPDRQCAQVPAGPAPRRRSGSRPCSEGDAWRLLGHRQRDRDRCPAVSDRIFMIFQRLHAQGRVPTVRGSALRSARRIVERHGGRSGVESTPAPDRRSPLPFQPATESHHERTDTPVSIPAAGRDPARRGQPGRRRAHRGGPAGQQAPQQPARGDRRRGGHGLPPQRGSIHDRTATGPDPARPEPAEEDGREVLAEIKADPYLERDPGRDHDRLPGRARHPRVVPAPRELLHPEAGASSASSSRSSNRSRTSGSRSSPSRRTPGNRE